MDHHWNLVPITQKKIYVTYVALYLLFHQINLCLRGRRRGQRKKWRHWILQTWISEPSQWEHVKIGPRSTIQAISTYHTSRREVPTWKIYNKIRNTKFDRSLKKNKNWSPRNIKMWCNISPIVPIIPSYSVHVNQSIYLLCHGWCYTCSRRQRI